MATVTGVGSWPAPGTHKKSWEGFTANGDVGTPLDATRLQDKTVTVTGTFGTGGALTIKGSNDGVNYTVLTDPQGNALTFTAAGVEAIMENPLFIRPEMTAGTGTIDIDCIIASSAGT
jgi:hypothetical protein